MMRSSDQPGGRTASFAIFPTFHLLLQILWQAGPGSLLSLLVLTVLSGVITPLLLVLTAALLDVIVRSLSQAHALSGLNPGALRLLLLLGGLVIGGQVIMYVQQTIQTLYQQKVTNVIKLRLAEHAAQLDLAFFDNPSFHNRLSNASNEAAYRPVTILQQLLTIGSTAVTVVWVAVLVLQWHWWILLLVVLISCIRYGVSAREGKMHVTLALQQTPLQRMTQYLHSILTSDLFAKELRLFDLSAFLLARYRRSLQTIYQQSLDQERRLAIVELFVQPVLMALSPILLAYAVLQALQRAITVGQFSLYSQSVSQLDTGIMTIITQGALLYENILFFHNLAAFLQMVPGVERVQQGSTDHPLLSPDVKMAGPTIDFCDVSFRYPDATEPTLDHFTLHIDPGEIVALVGANGAGKTTVIKLLAGLYHPTSGQILIDGRDITTLDRRRLRAYLSVIFQDYAIYHWSATDNIGVGHVAAIEDHARIEHAAEQSGFASVVQNFPEGYETVLGRWFERGQELSGGQRQLLALARALMKGAPVLILDEPGAALDVENEQAFFERLLSTHRLPQQTILFISHRYSTVRRADRIVVLEGGRLIEEGSHVELMQQDGRYAHLFASQMHMYTDEPAVPTNGMLPPSC
jgi:ATP-binding cassette subfamily B protein